MIIPTKRRPWEKKDNGNRPNSDKFYQTSAWKNLRAQHRRGSTKMDDGYVLLNIFCVDCYKERRAIVQGAHADHVVQRKSGGKDELSNIATLCDHHHAVKSAIEGNEMRKKK